MAETALSQVTSSTLFDLTGVVAVVTGGGTGIGLMMATTLIANGAASVCIIGPKQEDLDRIADIYNAAAESSGKPGRIYGLQGDISKKSEATRLAEEVGKREKYVTVLFNNAGIVPGLVEAPASTTAEAFRAAYFDAVSEDDFDRTFRTNAVGAYWLTFAFLPLLEKWKSVPGPARFAPQVIMTTSMNGWTKDPDTAGHSFPYMFSKAALGQATATLAHALLPLGVRVNGIAPGFFVTEMSAPGTADAATGQSRLPPGVHFDIFQVPGARPVAPGEVPAGTSGDIAVVVLCLVANWFVNGETVLVDGGTMLKHPSSW